MSVLYLVYGVPHKSKEYFLEHIPEDIFAIKRTNIETSFEEERDIVKEVLDNGENIVVDVYNAMPSVFESWFDFIDELDHDVKVIIISTPLNIIVQETELENDHIQSLYNNFIETIGWLYLNYKEKIINSAHLQ